MPTRRSIAVLVAAMVLVWTLPVTGGVVDVDDRSNLRADNEAPLADAGLDQEVEQGAWVMLDGGGSRDPDGELVAYEWSIETPNGSTMTPECSTCERTRFQATDVGVYAVTLTVTDDDGASRSDTLYVTVEAGDPPTGPSVSLSGPGELDVDETGTFTASFEAGSAPIERVRWQVDGEAVANRSVPSERKELTLARSFSTAGEREVSVTVVDAEGRTASDGMTLTVQSPEPAPSPDPSPDPGGDGGLTVSITGPDEVERDESGVFDAVVNGADSEVVAYEWSNVDDSDGNTASRQFVESAGSIVTLSVRVRTADGEVATATKEVEVIGPESLPEIVLDGPRFVEQGATANFEVTVFDEGYRVYWYTWEPADGDWDKKDPTYSRTFDEAVGETVNVTVKVHTPYGFVEETRMVRITETVGEPDESKAKPQVSSIDATKVPKEDVDDQYYWRFDAELLHWGGENVTVEWEFADGTTKRTTHQGLNGTTTSSVDVFFTYDPADDPFGRRGPRDRGLPVSVRAVDENGDTDTAEDFFVVTEYPRGSEPLEVSVSPDVTARAGTPLTFSISPVFSGEIDFGDGERSLFGTDPSDGFDQTAEVKHTYDQPGTYTVEVWTNDGRHEELVVNVGEKTYEVYKYQEKSTYLETTKAKKKPRGDRWEIDGVDEVIWDPTGITRTFRQGMTPERIIKSQNWKRAGTKIRTVDETYTLTATESPGSEWSLVEKNVFQDRKRVEYTLPDGTRIVGWKTVYYHRYEKTESRSFVYQVWKHGERTFIYEWEREVTTVETKYSHNKPSNDRNIIGDIETITFSCSNNDAPLHDKKCHPEYDSPEDSPDGTGPR